MTAVKSMISDRRHLGLSSHVKSSSSNSNSWSTESCQALPAMIMTTHSIVIA